MTQWGDRWLADGGAPVELRHHDCGETVGVSIRWAAGHEASPGELDLVPRRRARGVGRT